MSSSPQKHYEFHHGGRKKNITFVIVVASIDEMVEL